MPSDAEIWETAAGVEVYRHPDAMILEDPALAALADEWSVVGALPISRDDYARRSARWVDGWQVMLESYRRNVPISFAR